MGTSHSSAEHDSAAQRLAWRDWQTWAGIAAFIGVALISVPLSGAMPIKISGVNLTQAAGVGLGGALFGVVFSQRVRAHKNALSQQRSSAAQHL